MRCDSIIEETFPGIWSKVNKSAVGYSSQIISRHFSPPRIPVSQSWTIAIFIVCILNPFRMKIKDCEWEVVFQHTHPLFSCTYPYIGENNDHTNIVPTGRSDMNVWWEGRNTIKKMPVTPSTNVLVFGATTKRSIVLFLIAWSQSKFLSISINSLHFPLK